jgi:glutaredoxin
VKVFLAERGIQFEEKDVSEDQVAVFQLVRTYNSRTTPTTVIDDEVVIGFDPERLSRRTVQSRGIRFAAFCLSLALHCFGEFRQRSGGLFLPGGSSPAGKRCVQSIH